MKRYIRACTMTFSMFCAIPSPFQDWDEDARPLMMLFLPLVGVVIGLLWALSAFVIRVLDVPMPLGAALLCAYPFVITGFIHFDGFLDVTDAVKSWRNLDERLRILKDSNCGAFAVVASSLLVMFQFALFASVGEGANFHALILIPVISRTLAGLCVTVLRPISAGEYSGIYLKGAKRPHIAVFAVIATAVTLLGFVLFGKYGFVIPAVIAGYLIALFRAVKSLGGMSGDISGYALTIGELCGIAVYALI